jgi:predicted component of type VI protein secretion system
MSRSTRVSLPKLQEVTRATSIILQENLMMLARESTGKIASLTNFTNLTNLTSSDQTKELVRLKIPGICLRKS